MEHSLNQSLSYIRDTPLWIDFELKTAYSDRNPEVQMGIWKAAVLSKMRLHNWDTYLPLPGVIVRGHEWVFYLGFERNGHLVSPRLLLRRVMLPR